MSTWLLSNLCKTRGNSIPDFDKVKDCLPIAKRFINHENEEIETSACWCFANLTKYHGKVCTIVRLT